MQSCKACSTIIKYVSKYVRIGAYDGSSEIYVSVSIRVSTFVEKNSADGSAA
jgi:hypothetical protein